MSHRSSRQGHPAPGFTLVELLVTAAVLVVAGLLIANLVMPKARRA